MNQQNQIIKFQMENMNLLIIWESCISITFVPFIDKYHVFFYYNQNVMSTTKF